MKFVASAIVACAASASVANAFVPSPSFTRVANNVDTLTFKTTRQMAMDPSMFSDIPQHIDSLQSAFSSLLLSDEAVAAVTEAATDDNGWFGFLTGPIEGLLKLIHAIFVGIGLDANAWGISIIVLTLLIKVVTYPLTKSQLESTQKMQVLQPQIKSIQAKYASNPEVMNQKVAEFYQTNEVNPLAGCAPALIQLPVFIGLYRAVLTLAKADELNEPFLFLPSLEGPTYGADPAQASAWLFSGWENGVPSLGWEDTIAFLSIPIFLVVSQSLSQQLMQPKNATPEQEAAQNNIVLKLLPLLIGWFSLSVPAALGLYWVANNIITTALTVQIRSTLDANPPTTGGSGGASAAASVMDAPVSTFTPAPLREKPSGFAASADSDGVKPITPMDAEVIEVEEESDVPRADKSSSGKKKRKGKKKKN